MGSEDGLSTFALVLPVRGPQHSMQWTYYGVRRIVFVMSPILLAMSGELAPLATTLIYRESFGRGLSAFLYNSKSVISEMRSLEDCYHPKSCHDLK